MHVARINSSFVFFSWRKSNRTLTGRISTNRLLLSHRVSYVSRVLYGAEFDRRFQAEKLKLKFVLCGFFVDGKNLKKWTYRWVNCTISIQIFNQTQNEFATSNGISSFCIFFVCPLSDDYIRQNDFKKPSCKKEKSSWKFDRHNRDMDDDDEDDCDDLMDVNSKCTDTIDIFVIPIGFWLIFNFSGNAAIGSN